VNHVITRIIIFALLALEFILSASLFLQHLAADHTLAGRFNFCSVFAGGGCGQALNSNWAVILGIPLAGWGLVYAATLAMILACATFAGMRLRREATALALAAVIAAALAGLVLLGVMLSGRTAFCPLCAAVHAINLTLVPLIARLHEPGFRIHVSLKPGLLTVTAVLIALVAYQQILIAMLSRDTTTIHRPPPVLAQAEAITIPIDDGDATIGPDHAPLQLVVFSDFQCPTCAAYAQHLHRWRDTYGDLLRITFKHYPLSMACNETMPVDMHPLACDAAVAAQAAQRQNQFWPYHDALFHAELTSSGDLITLADELGLDPTRFIADLSDPATRRKVLDDIELGNRLSIEGTPSLFLNGHPLQDIHPDSVAGLLAQLASNQTE
jgi:protein-disulfide isomerase/uncharacterized membrane protein